MPSFALPDHPYIYRPLRRGLKGWDVYSVQTALLGLNYSLPRYGADGDWGAETDAACKKFQTDRRLTADAIAGTVTQAALALALGVRLGPALPSGLLRGVYTFEGGNILGNHTSRYDNGTRDFGVVQDNLPEAEAADGFDTPGRIAYYVAEATTRYDRYRPHVPDHRRCWELAAGAWNRPAWTDWLANPLKWPLRNKDGSKRSLTQAERDWIEGYISRVTTYVVW